MNQIAGAGRLTTSKIYLTVFVALMAAITGHSSLNVPLVELPLHMLGWGVLLTIGLTTGWVAAKQKRDTEQSTQNLIALIAISVFVYQTINNTLDVALNSLLTLLLVGLCFRLTHRRTLYFILLASFCLVLYSASLSKDSLFLIYIVIYVISIVITLVMDYYSSCIQQSLSSEKIHHSIPFIRTGMMVGLPIILITSGLYLLVPRPAAMHYGFFPAGGKNYYHDAIWHNQANQSENDLFSEDEVSYAPDVSSDETNPNSEQSNETESNYNEQQRSAIETQKSRNQDAEQLPEIGKSLSLNDSVRPEISDSGSGQGISNDIVLYMQGPRGQYLRGAIFDDFDGKSWYRLDQEITKLKLDNGKLVLKNVGKETFLNQYTITTKKQLNNKNLIVIPPESVELSFPGTVVAEDSYGSLYSPKKIRPDTIYSVHIPAKILPGRPYIEQTTKPDNAAYLQLPTNLPARVTALSDQISEGKQSSMDKALAMESYLRNEYEFSYQTVFSQNNIPLDEFLFETKYGHCEYFATALTILLRAQNIPARLVTGYSVTTFNPITGYYEARVLDGHAWVEAWIEGKGWVTFEPTAAYALPKQTQAPDPAHAIQEYYEKLSFEADQLAPGSLEATIYATLNWFFALFNQVIDASWQLLKSVTLSIGGFLAINIWWILSTAIIGYILSHYMIYRIKKLLACYRVKRLSSSNPLLLLSECYSEMETMLSRYGSPRDPSWTLRQYRREISRDFPDLETNFSTICTAYNSLRYSSQMPDNTSAKIIKSETLEVLQHAFRTPIPARNILEPLLMTLGFSEKHAKTQ